MVVFHNDSFFCVCASGARFLAFSFSSKSFSLHEIKWQWLPWNYRFDVYSNFCFFSPFFFWRYVPSSWQSSSSKIDKSLTLNDRYISYLTNRKSFKVGLSPSKKFGFIRVNESPLKISFFMASQTGTQTITMNI